MNPNLRSAAFQSLYFAQYMQSVHGNARYIKGIIKFFTMTDSGLQPLISDIRDYATPKDAELLNECWKGYQEFSGLVNSWINSNKQ